MKIDNGTGGSRETSTGKPERVDERGRESMAFIFPSRGLSLGQVIGQAHHLRLLTLPRSWRLLRPRTSSTVALACHHIQSHASKSLCLVILDEVVGRTPCHGCTHRPRKASTKRGNYRRTTFLLGPPPLQVHP